MALKERQLRVGEPLLRKKQRLAEGSGEVEVPAYTALQADQRLADRMLELVLNGVFVQGIAQRHRPRVQQGNVAQRCRNHEVRNILGHLPKMQHEGSRQVEQHAAWLEREWPSAAAGLREGLAELLTVNRLGLPAALRGCLTTTNFIDSPHGAYASTRGALAAGATERWRCSGRRER